MVAILYRSQCGNKWPFHPVYIKTTMATIRVPHGGGWRYAILSIASWNVWIQVAQLNNISYMQISYNLMLHWNKIIDHPHFDVITDTM